MNKPPPSLLLIRNSCTGTVVSVAWARGIGLSVEWEPDLRAPGLLKVGSGFTEPYIYPTLLNFRLRADV